MDTSFSPALFKEGTVKYGVIPQEMCDNLSLTEEYFKNWETDIWEKVIDFHNEC